MRAKITLLLTLILVVMSCQWHSAVASSTDIGVPSSVYIPKIAKEVPIIPIGVTATGNLDVPHNFVQAGWYEYGALPGQIGSAVLDGHVGNGATIPGVFKHLNELTVGDDIYVAAKSGTVLHFKVIATSVYSRTASTTAIFANSGVPLLKIITCYGTFIPQDETYNERLVVTAQLVG